MVDASRNDPELLARRAESQARIEAERQEQNRLAAEAEARRQSELVTFPAMPLKLATELVIAFERFRGAGRAASELETEAFSRMVHGEPLPPSFPVIRLMHGLPMPVPASGVPAKAVEAEKPHTDPVALDNVLKLPPKGSRKPEKTPELESGMFLIDGDDD
ncbi:hypothetical protein [Methylobacterium sp. WCS2018Hpa-22]|uniref:hypothetical protein n=1 Tax=Methylobacterium sp. WCS2018Hpa-22 TaxID=3073633 RepID=UPI00288B5AE9|nr:hypothetical protein [Methylobacterium sp. WCS2018Hpa-22]